MLALLVALAIAGPSREEVAARKIVEDQGFAITSIAPLEDRPRWFAFTATRGGRACEGTVEVQKMGKKPKGVFAAACEENETPGE
ncbi:MAG: hypothetical protein EP330_00850 [Deltaproteobacteria bacterium]|nr:MAG: hypothetical protein EP330_00850 [Deltaproteobacteria bacterium]